MSDSFWGGLNFEGDRAGDPPVFGKKVESSSTVTCLVTKNLAPMEIVTMWSTPEASLSALFIASASEPFFRTVAMFRDV